MGWTTLKNGELLVLASAQFDVFVTVDRNLSFQQDIVSFSIAVVVLQARTNRLADLRPSCPASSRPSRPPRRARRNLSASLRADGAEFTLPLRHPAEGGGPEPAPRLEQGASGEAFTLDPRIRENDNSKWSKPALARHVHDLVRRSHQYRGSRELTARLKGQLRWTADIRATGFEQRHRPVDRVSYRETGIVHR